MSNSGKRVTMRDIAAKLGVSPATVHRALAEKGNVSEDTLRVIQKTAMDMGYHTRKLASALAENATKIAVVVRSIAPEYQAMIKDGVRRAISELVEYNVQGDIVVLELENYLEELSNQLLKISESDYNGVIFYVSQTDYALDQDIIDKLMSRNIKIGSIYRSEGIENVVDFSIEPAGYRTGAVAANMLAINGLGKGSKVVVFLGKKDFPVHKRYLDGFTAECKELGIEVFDVIEHRDNPNIAYYAAEQFLRENPEIDGIYSCTATSAPICRAIHDLGMQGRHPMIATDIMSDIVPYIKDGTVTASLFQDPFKMGYKAFRNLYYAISGRKVVEKHETINPQIVVKANVDYYARFCDTQNRIITEST